MEESQNQAAPAEPETAAAPQAATEVLPPPPAPIVLREIPRYRCFKEVRAFKIGKVRPTLHGAILEPAEEGVTPTSVSHSYMLKHDPAVGAYYVRYQDGYESLSPAKAFEEGYTKIGE